MRHQVFVESSKHKRLKKIKSRKFRKLAKKDREKGKALEVDDLATAEGAGADEAREKEQRLRAEERMTQRHKNTSKWVKRQLEHGNNDAGDGDDETRKAVGEQLKLNQRLVRKAAAVDGKVRDEQEDEAADDAWLQVGSRPFVPPRSPFAME
jgi:U3 small nucleolar RNA-associated protein 14